MKKIAALTLAFGLIVSPAQAQDGEVQEGFNLMEEGAKLLMRGLMSELEPTISDLQEQLVEMTPVIREFADQMGLALSDLLSRVDDFRHYDAPEFLPNGDIIIRRKPDAPIWIPDNETGEVDL